MSRDLVTATQSTHTHPALSITKPSATPATSLHSVLPKQHGNQDSSLSFHLPALERVTSHIPQASLLSRLPSPSTPRSLNPTSLLVPFSCTFTEVPSPMRASSAFAPPKLCNTVNQSSHALISLVLSTGCPDNHPRVLFGTHVPLCPSTVTFSCSLLASPLPNPGDSAD